MLSAADAYCPTVLKIVETHLEHCFVTIAVSFFQYNLICIRFRSATSGLCPAVPLACTVGHVATFAVNVVLMASQWQHCV